MGCSDREEQIALELREAGITLAMKEKSLFPSYGKLGYFDFFRGPWYWLAVGEIPLTVAQELYDRPDTRPYLSVAGLNDKARPDDRLSGAGRKHDRGNPDIYVWAKPKTLANGLSGYFVPFYGITSPEALAFFVQTLKKHHLV